MFSLEMLFVLALKVGSLDGLREGRQMLQELDVYDDYVEAMKASGNGPKRWTHNDPGRLQRIRDNQDSVTNRPKSKKQLKPHYEPGFRNEKLSWNSESKIGSLDNVGYKPGGGDKLIEEQNLEWDHVTSRVDADNPQYIRQPPTKKIFTEKVRLSINSCLTLFLLDLKSKVQSNFLQAAVDVYLNMFYLSHHFALLPYFVQLLMSEV